MAALRVSHLVMRDGGQPATGSGSRKRKTLTMTKLEMKGLPYWKKYAYFVNLLFSHHSKG